MLITNVSKSSILLQGGSIYETDFRWIITLIMFNTYGNVVNSCRCFQSNIKWFKVVSAGRVIIHVLAQLYIISRVTCKARQADLFVTETRESCELDRLRFEFKYKARPNTRLQSTTLVNRELSALIHRTVVPIKILCHISTRTLNRLCSSSK